jgi:hypothetical protein
MNMVEGKIVHLLTGKHSLREVSVDELRNIADRQPFFSVAQLLLAKKMKLDNDPGFLQQVQKTALYFPNVHWLHYQLNDEFENENVTTTPAPVQQIEEPVAEVQPVETVTTIEIQEHKEEQQPVEHIAQPIEETAAAIPSTEKEPDSIVEEEVYDSHDADDTDYDEAASAADNPPATTTITATNLKLADLIQQQAAAFHEAVEKDAKLPIDVEPYHTIDYFASQGIRLDPAMMGQDKLGQQVRKFTDWLKQMKRVQPDPNDLGTSPELEHLVQDIAANSNEAKEIVTEAMAQVLIKQGKVEKAVQLYLKLSFLNPDKSAYFAAKIQEIKGL